MLSQIQEAILVINRRGAITFLNAAAEHLFGVAAVEVRGQPLTDVLRIEDAPAGTGFGILRSLHEKGTWQQERRVRLPDGTAQQLFVSVSLLGEDGSLRGAIVVLRNLTRVREREAAIQHRLQVEGALVEISRMLVSSEEVDFEEILGMVGRAVGAGCVYLVTIPADDQPFQEDVLNGLTTHQLGMNLVAWYREKDDESTHEREGLAITPEIKDLLDAPGGISASSEDDQATAFAVPVLSSNDQLYGYLGIEHASASRREARKQWQEEDIRLLQVLGDMLATYFERNMAEQALRDSEERWRRLVESHPEPILISDAGRILYINRAGADVFGASRAEQVMGRSILDFVSAELHDRLIRREKALMAGEVPESFQHEIIRLDGEDRIVESFSVPVVYQRRHAVQTVLRDITERKRSEERYRTFVETISEGIWHCDLDRPVVTNALAEIQASLILEHAYVVDCNDVVARALEVATPERLIGKRLGRLVRDIGLVADFVEEGYRLRNREYSFARRDGSMRHFVINAVGTVERGRLVRIWGSFIDVTERAELERHMVAALEEQQQRIGRDLHDGVGQLLTGIRMLCQNLAESKDLAEDKREQAQKVARYAEEASQHVRTIYKGLTPVQLYQEGLAAALEELVHNTDVLPDIDCTFDHDGVTDIDNRDTTLHLYRIAQEATNNVLKHARAAHVHITFRMENDHILLQIQDNGIGFDVEASGGHSLGLDSMFYRARAIQADFNVMSEPGKGTIVRCTLPLSAAEQSFTILTTEA